MTNEQLPFQVHSATSREAAESAKPSAAALRERVYAFIAEHPLVTDEEIAEGLGMNPNTERPRRIELWNASRIYAPDNDGRTHAGRRAMRWKVLAR